MTSHLFFLSMKNKVKKYRFLNTAFKFRIRTIRFNRNAWMWTGTYTRLTPPLHSLLTCVCKPLGARGCSEGRWACLHAQGLPSSLKQCYLLLKTNAVMVWMWPEHTAGPLQASPVLDSEVHLLSTTPAPSCQGSQVSRIERDSLAFRSFLTHSRHTLYFSRCKKIII